MPLSRVQSGLPRRPLSALERNALADTVAAVERLSPAPSHTAHQILRGFNTTSDVTFRRGQVVGFKTTSQTHSVCQTGVDEGTFQEVLGVRCEVARIPDHLTRWAVALQDIEPGWSGAICTAGECWAKLLIRDVLHQFAAPRHDDPSFAVSTVSSFARILWLEPDPVTARTPYPWRWARLRLEPSSPFFVEGFTTVGLSPAALTTGTGTTFTVDIDADLETLTATTAAFTDGPQWDDPNGVFCDLLTAGPSNETLTVRLYRLDDTHAKIDPPANTAATGVTARWLQNTFTPRTVGVRLREQRGNAYVRTPYVITAESVDQSLSLPEGTRVVCVPWTLNRWRILWAECSQSLSVANASQRLL